MNYFVPPPIVMRMTTKYLLRLKSTNQLTMWLSDFSEARGKFAYRVERVVIEVRDLSTQTIIGKIHIVCAPQTTRGYIDEEQARYWNGAGWSAHPEVITNWIQHLDSEYALGWSSLCG